MIKQIDGKWHAYSEAGKHFGGPYATEEQAKHRIAQMEYFKHVKKAGVMGLGAQATIPSFLATKTRNEKALGARIDLSKGLIGAERTIADRVDINPDGQSSETINRILTNPGTAAGLGFGVAASEPYVMNKFKRYLIQNNYANAAARLKQKVDEGVLTEMDQRLYGPLFNFVENRILHNVDKAKPVDEMLASIKTPGFNKILPWAALTGTLAGAGVLLKRHRDAKRILREEEHAANSFIRTKLREGFMKESGFPTALVDDAAIWGAKAVNLLKSDEEQKKLENIKKKTGNFVKKEIAAIEKNATNEVQMAVDAIRNHPRTIAAIQALKNTKPAKSLQELDEYGKAFMPHVREMVKNPAFQAAMPGSTEALAGYYVGSKHIQKMISSPKYNKVVTTAIQFAPVPK